MAIGVALMYVCIPYACVDVLMLDANLDEPFVASMGPLSHRHSFMHTIVKRILTS